ncbi:two pore potassium channel protein sup-9-like [Rhopilema esculentum]|uniref:two pore potassium channel protein sup-9-like n=1 Tax=Rhopilema esculentum TaxID=499914 RepID=UPI0031CE99B6|eukprot:gene6231-11642_t
MEKPSLKKILIRLGVFISYCLVGAAVFQLVEKENQQKLQDRYRRSLDKFMARFNISKVDMNQLEELILKSGKQSIATNWSFSSAVFFAGSTLLTVGYGNITPKTTAGQAFCLVFAIIGIPIACLALKSLGERITVTLISFTRWIHTIVYKDRQRVNSVHLKVTIFTFFVTLAAILLLAGMAKLKRDEWTYFECIYFAIITFTTIGFGDYIPVYEDNFSEFDIVSLTLGVLAGFTLVSSLLCSVSNMIEEHSASMIEKARKTINRRRGKSKDSKGTTSDTEINYQGPLDGIPGKFIHFVEGKNEVAALPEEHPNG